MDECFAPVKFLKVPEACKEGFIEALPAFLTKRLDPHGVVQVVDIWENQSRTSKKEGWKFDGEINILVCIGSSGADAGTIQSSVANWPGWFHFDNEYLIQLEYPGRFQFCDFCRHTAQDLTGPNQRHENDACLRITCKECGHSGHDVSKPDPTEKYKKACVEGKRRREEKEEARKGRKIEDKEAKKRAAEEEAKRKAEEEEAKRRAEEETKKKAEEEEARKLAEEEEAARQKATQDSTVQSKSDNDKEQTEESDAASEPEEGDAANGGDGRNDDDDQGSVHDFDDAEKVNDDS